MVVVVGAGLAGCAAARVLADAGETVEIWEKSDFVGGTVYDYKDPSGAYIHQYGPHIFHTNHQTVFDFLSRFTEWTDYTHGVLGEIHGQLCPIPFNLESIDRCFSPIEAKRYQETLIAEIGNGQATTVGKLLASEKEDLRALGKFVYENVFLNYTKKQWGLPPEALGDQVMSRVPVRASYDNRYFDDKYQKMPKLGYTEMVQKMIPHRGITLKLKKVAEEHLSFKHGQLLLDGEAYDAPVIYTGSLDALLGYQYGALPYRSLRFRFEEKGYPVQPVAVVNYPNAHDYTRITEFSHFYPGYSAQKSTILYEYPIPYQPLAGEQPYYPIPLAENESQYMRYRNEVSACENFYLAGRLGNYKYINMDMAVLDGIQAARAVLSKKIK